MALTVYALKSKFCDALRPLALGLAKRGVSANFVTGSAAALSVGYGSLLCLAPTVPALWLAAPAVLFARMALNAMDGVIARECRQESVRGAFFNELGDVVSDIALIAPLALAGAGGLAVATFAGMAVATELSGALGQRFGGSRRYEGPMGKSDRAVAIGAMFVAFGFFGHASAPFLTLACGLLSGACAWTAANRVRSSLAEIEARVLFAAEQKPFARARGQLARRMAQAQADSQS